MSRLCLVALLLGLLAVVGCHGSRPSSHTHHHYYDHVTNNIHHHGDDHDDDDDDHGHIYRFHIGDSKLGAYAYLDSEGHLRGVYIDFLLKVCRRAGKKCHYMLDDFNRCWDVKGKIEKPGIGLLLGAYDGCIGMLKTPERVNSFDFTKPFSPAPEPSLYFKAGGVPGDPTNIEGKKIGFVHAWALNPKCLKRSGRFSGDFEVVEFDTHDALIHAVVAGEIDAAVSAAAFEAKLEGVEKGGPVFKCGVSGLSVMTHYGSDVLNWWDDAVDSLVKEQGWKKMCEAGRRAHGDQGQIFCLE